MQLSKQKERKQNKTRAMHSKETNIVAYSIKVRIFYPKWNLRNHSLQSCRVFVHQWVDFGILSKPSIHQYLNNCTQKCQYYFIKYCWFYHIQIPFLIVWLFKYTYIFIIMYLNISGLKVNEEKITNNKTNWSPNSKAKKTEYSTEETHLQFSNLITISIMIAID